MGLTVIIARHLDISEFDFKITTDGALLFLNALVYRRPCFVSAMDGPFRVGLFSYSTSRNATARRGDNGRQALCAYGGYLDNTLCYVSILKVHMISMLKEQTAVSLVPGQRPYRTCGTCAPDRWSPQPVRSVVAVS